MVPGGENGGAGGKAPYPNPAEQLKTAARWWQGASWKGRLVVFVPLAIIILVLVLWILSRFYTDYLWYQELGFTNVFWTRIWARVVVMVVAGVVFFGIFYGNLRLARAFLPKIKPAEDQENVFDLVDTRRRGGRRIFMAIAVLLAVFFAIGYGKSWESIWLFFNQVDFGFDAPIFGRDASFFIFTLPILRMVLTFLMLCFIFSLIGILGVYVLGQAIVVTGRRSVKAPSRVIAHVSVIVAVIILGKAADWALGVWGLAYSNRGVTHGPSYTDVIVQIPVLRALAIIAIIAAVLILVNIYFKGWRLPVIAVGVIIVAWIFAGLVYPALVQTLKVSPTELEKETPYISNNIRATRWAFGIDGVQTVPFQANVALDMESIENNPGTIDNVRIWDPGPALLTYRQIQEIRTYYSFTDVDVDRYMIDDEYRQVLVAAREFESSKLSDQAQTWVNQHLTYTHGYGVVVSPVNEATSRGLPRLFVSDLPPRGETSLQVTRPEIYYGELPDQFVLVNTTAKEFDYPLGDENVFTEYEGKGGVGIGGIVRRVAFGLRFGSIKLLVSDYLRSDSRIMFKRSLSERVRSIAPFLRYDNDPYIVIRDDGSLAWIWDAYTVSDRFPNAELSSSGLNYIRNSIKVVIDAYNGDVTFYQIDPDDALATTWNNVFPGILTPGSEMPDDIRRHLRYPEDFLSVQAEMLSVYHMNDPQVFYNKEDVWEIPTEIYEGKETPVDPYYLIMVFPGETEEEFVLLQPFAPRTKQNMISWMAGRMDGENYGELRVLSFPKDKVVFGPAQVEARITNDPVISAQITLWDQAGSDVIRGNLLVIPVDDSVIYVEPLYLQSEQSAIPELTRVIVAYGDIVVMEKDLRSALQAVFEEEGSLVIPESTTTTTVAPDEETTTTTMPVTTTTSVTIPGHLPEDVAGLLELAEKLYDEAREAQRTDDWATYGAKIKQLGEVISALRALEGATP